MRLKVGVQLRDDVIKTLTEDMSVRLANMELACRGCAIGRKNCKASMINNNDNNHHNTNRSHNKTFNNSQMPRETQESRHEGVIKHAKDEHKEDLDLQELILIASDAESMLCLRQGPEVRGQEVQQSWQRNLYTSEL